MAEKKPRIIEETDIVPADWVDGVEGQTVDEWIEVRQNRSYKTGIRVGYEQAAGYVMKQALELFKRGKKDDEAMRLREMSEELEALGQEQTK